MRGKQTPPSSGGEDKRASRTRCAGERAANGEQERADAAHRRNLRRRAGEIGSNRSSRLRISNDRRGNSGEELGRSASYRNENRRHEKRNLRNENRILRDENTKSLNSEQNVADLSQKSVVKTIAVEESASLLDFLKEKLYPQSASSIKNLLKHGCIGIEKAGLRAPDSPRRAMQTESHFDFPIARGDTVFVLSARQNRYGLHHPMLRILYEDNDIIAADKSSGLHSVDSTGGGVDNAASILDRYVKNRNPDKRIYVVHRLDRDTSGVMIFAKTREAQNRLVSHWNESICERAYVAVVEGHLPARGGTIDSYLYEDAHKIVHSCDNPESGDRAITHYRVLNENEAYSLILCNLETGRTNQIRVHMASIGCPVAGDLKYGAASDVLGRLGLHARSIVFDHPITRRRLSFESPEPPSFGGLFE